MKAKPSPGEGHRHRRGELDGGAGDAGDVAGELVEDDHASGAGGRGESHEDAGNRQRALQSGRIQQKQAADHDGESDHHGKPQALLEQEGGQRHGDDRGRGGQNGAEAHAEQAVGSENGHHGETETGAGEGHEQVLATADVPGQSLAGDDEDQAHGQRANNEAHEADFEGRQRQRAGNDARRSEHHDGCDEAQKVLHRCDLRAHGKPLLLGAGRGARRLSAPPPSF